MNSQRLLYSVVISFFVILGIAPMVMILGMIGVFRYPRFWEFLVAGFLFELLYGSGGWATPFPFPIFLGSALLFVILEIVRTRLR